MLMKLLLIQLLWQEILQLKIELQENLQPKIHWHNDPENLQIQQPNMQLQMILHQILLEIQLLMIKNLQLHWLILPKNLQPNMQLKLNLQPILWLKFQTNMGPDMRKACREFHS